MTTILSPVLVQGFRDNNGNPLFGGQLFSYQAGTTTPQATYTDSTGGTPNANPTILNARGEANIWIPPNTAYKFVLQDSAGNTIWTVDNVVSSQLVTLYGGVDTGSTNAYAISFTANFSTLQNGIVIYWVPSHINTSASTINVNNLGAVSITHPDGSALLTNDLVAGAVAEIVYYNGAWILMSGAYQANLFVKGLMQSFGATSSTWVDTSADFGTFVPAWNSCFTSNPTGNLNWVRQGNLVLLYTAGSTALTATSNSTTLGFTNLPSAIQPANTASVKCSGLMDNSVGGLLGTFNTNGGAVAGIALSLVSGSYIKDNLNGFTNTGTKGLNGFACIYPIR